MKSLKTFNGVKLYSYNSKNKVLIWYAESDLELDSEGRIPITIYYGQQDGKISQKIRYVNSGKNKGKSNETTIQEQALLTIEQLYTAQMDKSYVFDLAQYETPKNAMLAHKFKDRMHTLPLDDEGNFTAPVYIQPKLNGIRCESRKTSDMALDFLSRTNKLFTSFPHLVQDCLNVLEVDKSLDSELFNPNILFEHIASMVNGESDREIRDEAGNVLHTLSEIKLYTYDLMGYDDLTFTERLAVLKELSKKFSSNIILVDTFLVKTLSELKAKHEEFKRKGYEGTMVRVGDSLYEYSKRSNGLLKYKDMEQAEFRIDDIYPAENDPDKVMFKLWSEEGQNHFDCALKGDKMENLKYLKNKELYLEQYLTVDYQALSKYNMPLFPVGIMVRTGKVVDGKFIPDV